ncbi:unnamed protein product [Adineta ricciae]|uniref:Fe2OG dioxygenase domain-containing protein n=1 Tax=Adineta ricciae TaxID=249248 RepID=A0A815X538_ADIRI|nr:unnamed protein product [Adineta ricciae]
MSHQEFLGNIDLSVSASLLKNYRVESTQTDADTRFRTIKHDNDLVLIELGHLLTPEECNEIVHNTRHQKFECMHNKYDIRRRNNSRLIVMDEQLADMLWQRLKSDDKLLEFSRNMKPLGFNVQGQWQLDGINPAMRLNKYKENEHFAVHKDAQYAPSGDERSLFSLLIYLSDEYDEGETKFYFPKQKPSMDIKGLTIREEIKAFGGLTTGYECISVKPKKGYAILFTHNLLHEAIAPKTENGLKLMQRIVLRSDILVKRTGKPLGFAVCPEEEEDYFACLNFFREAQQNELKDTCALYESEQAIYRGELYERSLSIRYCYPRLLESKLTSSNVNHESIIKRLPVELWLHIFQFMNENDVQYFTFAYPEFQFLHMVSEAQMNAFVADNPLRSKYLPSIHQQFGCQTLFRFPDTDFFLKHVHGCCRVAAVYAFFLLGHSKDATTYIVRYDRNTDEVCELEIEKMLEDVFYNRNCYGALYQVKQIDENVRQPKKDLNASVDRTCMSNRHDSQFIGEDLRSRYHLQFELVEAAGQYELEEFSRNVDEYDVLRGQRRKAEQISDLRNDSKHQELLSKDGYQGFCEHSCSQLEKQSGTSLFRMMESKDQIIDRSGPCIVDHDSEPKHGSIQIYNHLVFDFHTHQLQVEKLPTERFNMLTQPYLHRNIIALQSLAPGNNSISFYRVNIEKLAEKTQGFNHASCQCVFPKIRVNQFAFLDYISLSHVYLSIVHNDNEAFVLAAYEDIVAF